ncbi:hypothetical protein [Acinetobacter sp. 16]|uniref:hypothetical protein n=1 Tax=Acinetobacter sp. 16 TaxID=3081771 RepID=UPI00296FB267|nr:hypothetical protein [Acinetobacter sp. 16]
MAYLKNLKKIGVNTTVLATSLALGACGGGGGYYGNNDSSNNNQNNTGGNQSETDTTKVAQSLTVTLQDAEGKTLQTAQDNSQVKVAIKVLNADKGGIAGKDIRLSITDADKIGVESTSSKVTSDENGVATFTLDIPALQAATGKVQLTAVVDGTTISMPYTLNIQKASAITSDYNLSVAQGTVLNLPKGSADIAVQVTDTNGGVKPGQTVQLTLPAEMQGKFVIASGSSISTDTEGKATFKITANADLTTAEIAQFVATSQTLTFKLIDEHRAERQATAALTFNDISKTVSVLEVITPDTSIAAKAGTAKVRVFAKNSNGDILANTKVKLAVEAVAASYGVTLDKAEATTNAQGYAEFTLSSNATHPIALAQLGIQLTATYSENNQNIKGNATVQVVTADETVDNQEAIQRLEIASSYKVNAKNDDVTITVKAIDFTGFGAKKGKVTLSLNPEAQSNGVTFEGASTKDVGTNGIVTFKLKTNATTVKAVDALVKAGITATFTTDNNVTNKIDIAVEDEAVSEEKVRYLAFEPITQRFDYTKSQVIKVRVQAVGESDSALKGESISLTRTGLITQQLQDLGLTPKGSSTKQTDENGFAEFEFQYTFANTQEQKDLVLNPAGIRLLAKSTNDKTQILDLKFKEPSATTDVTLESLVIDTVGLATLAVNTPVTLNVTVKATGSDGQVYKNQKVGLGLNEAALQNGASIVGGASKTTDANGNASFQIQITAKNVTELENLIANGLTLAVKGAETDITALRKIELAKPAVVYQDLANFTFTKVDGTPLDTVSVLGGEIRVKVVARDAAGNAIPNTPISVALSSLVSSRVSLDGVPATTNSKGEAEFTVTVSEGKYDESLIKNGIIFAVVGTNLNNGDRLQQTSSIGITAPANALNPRLRADVNIVSAGKTIKVFASIKDEMGINTAAGTPMRLNLSQAARDAGVRFAGNVDTISVVVAKDVDTAVDLVIPQGLSSATLSSFVVTGTIKDPRGNDIPTNLTFTVEDVVNPNHLVFGAPSKAMLDVNGDESIVTVQLLNASNQPVRNQDITLSANHAGFIIIGNPGSGGTTNTSSPSTVKTDSNGNAFFSVKVDGTTVNKALLLASQIELTASNTSANGAETTQITRLNTFESLPPAPAADQPARYSLRISAKPTMNVRADTAEVTATLVDSNGGGVADKYVSLSIEDFARNGAIIVGASGKTTDENGQAVFMIRVDEAARRNYTAAAFIADDLHLTAHFKETGYLEATQITQVDIVQASVQAPIASIVIGVNPTEVTSSDGGVYYTRNMSVSVTDFDGKPLPNQVVTLEATPTTYIKGRNIWRLAPVAGAAPATKWVFANEQFFDLSNPNIYMSGNVPMNNMGTPADPNDDVPATTITNVATSCVAPADGSAIGANNTPTKVVTFVGQSGVQQNTFTTDANGKFDFAMRYPKVYAQWLNVNISASSTVASLPNRTTYSVGLPSLAGDYSSDGTYSPNAVSPYGTTFTCP